MGRTLPKGRVLDPGHRGDEAETTSLGPNHPKMVLHWLQIQHNDLLILNILASNVPPSPLPPLIIPTASIAMSTISSLSTTRSQAIRPLLPQERIILETLFKQSPSSTCHVSVPNAARVSIQSFHTLQHGQWMDNEVINGFLSLLTNRDYSHHTSGIIPLPSMHLSMHFYTKLVNTTDLDPSKRGYHYEQVA
jgi:hypothetical protein